ncbi:MAG TPA: lipid-binding SYLF domain-containing protein [Bryobacteraceae bacterium]|nr:lipid-binding SYLF domain-containing protein [Bryobacteraceae bacterium]
MKRCILTLALVSFAQAQETSPDKRLEHSTSALRAFLNSESPIPKDLVGKSQCIVVTPGLIKGAFLFGEKYGRGFAACRKSSGGWSSPAAIAIEGGSSGLQLGGSSTDLIFLVMNMSGMNRLLGDKFTLGGEASIAAGPVGGTTSANTDVWMTAEMISYSRSKGLFAGVSLEGATLRPDGGENKKLYGHDVSNRDVLSGKIAPPKGARAFVALLVKHAKKAK